MGTFIGHEPCPSCGSRDNLARYADGGAYCFGCQHVIPPTHFSPVGEEDPIPVVLPKDLVTELPVVNQEWLEQYLTKEEIRRHFVYSAALQRHVYVHINDVVDPPKIYWEARSVIKTTDGKFTHVHPKTVSRGVKPFFILGQWRTNGQVVIVEDIISAIKVARHTGAIPLFGSACKDEYLLRLCKIPSVKEIVIWLDKDKYKEAIALAKKIAPLKNIALVSTDKDPKALSDTEIRQELYLTYE